MKINSHNLPAAPQPSALSRSGTVLAQLKAFEPAANAGVTSADATPSARPVRISRFPEEAALFAYSRNATLAPPPIRSQIDEYV